MAPSSDSITLGSDYIVLQSTYSSQRLCQVLKLPLCNSSLRVVVILTV